MRDSDIHMRAGTDDPRATAYGGGVMDLLVMIEGDTLDEFMRYMSALLALAKRHDEPRRLRIAVDFDGFKVKVNEHVWSPPLGPVKTGDDAR